MAKFIIVGCKRIKNGHELGDPSNGCKNNFFEWIIGGGDLYGSTRGFCTRKEKKLCMQTQGSFVWAQAIVEDVVPQYRFVLNQQSFCGSQTDHLLYVKQTGEYLLVVIVYMDDLIILASNVTQLKWLQSKLEKEFRMSNLGELCY